jgi:hypothetical protein
MIERCGHYLMRPYLSINFRIIPKYTCLYRISCEAEGCLASSTHTSHPIIWLGSMAVSPSKIIFF